MGKTTKNLRLGGRDCLILKDIVEAGGVLDSRTIHDRRFPNDRTGEACLRRLRLLRAHDFLWAIAASVTFGPAPMGRLPIVYGLTPRGADLVEELGGDRPAVAPASLSSYHLDHRLGMARLRLVVNDACRRERLSLPEWIGEYDPRPEGKIGPRAKFSERFRLCHQYPHDQGMLACWPDAACLIAIPGTGAGTIHRLLILWEYDRSTERLAQVYRKLPGYGDFLDAGDHRQLFPHAEVDTTRVFLVTQTEERRQTIASEIRDLAVTQVVRLAHIKSLTPASFFRLPVWFTVEGQGLSILQAS